MKSRDELRAAIREAAPFSEEHHVDDLIILIRKIIREDLLGQRELRERFNRGSSAVSMQIWRGGGPPIAGQIAKGRIWLRWDVEEYIKENPKSVRHDSPEGQEAS